MGQQKHQTALGPKGKGPASMQALDCGAAPASEVETRYALALVIRIIPQSGRARFLQFVIPV
jgi:hypothetical protein